MTSYAATESAATPAPNEGSSHLADGSSFDPLFSHAPSDEEEFRSAGLNGATIGIDELEVQRSGAHAG